MKRLQSPRNLLGSLRPKKSHWRKLIDQLEIRRRIPELKGKLKRTKRLTRLKNEDLTWDMLNKNKSENHCLYINTWPRWHRKASDKFQDAKWFVGMEYLVRTSQSSPAAFTWEVKSMFTTVFGVRTVLTKRQIQLRIDTEKQSPSNNYYM